MVRMGEINRHIQPSTDRLLPRKFLAVVRRDRVPLVATRWQQSDRRCGYGINLQTVHFLDEREAGYTLHECNQRPTVLLANNGANLPVPNPRFLAQNGGPLINTHPVLDLAAPIFGAVAISVIFVPVSQELEQVATLVLVGPNIPINALMADGYTLLLCEPPGHLLRTPVQPQLLFKKVNYLWRNFSRFGSIPVTSSPL